MWISNLHWITILNRMRANYDRKIKHGITVHKSKCSFHLFQIVQLINLHHFLFALYFGKKIIIVVIDRLT